MTLITIRELSQVGSQTPNPAPAAQESVPQRAVFNAAVSFNHGPEHPMTVCDPFTEVEEDRLRWYLEETRRFPFLNPLKARQAADSLQPYGERLFEQVFSGTVMKEYNPVIAAGIGQLQFEIAGSPEFHSLHWEALKDPRLPRAFALEAPMARKNLTSPVLAAATLPSPMLNMLVVTARPGGAQDVGYRNISRPLVEGLKTAGFPARLDILRPGSYAALSRQLEAVRDQHGAGFYHLIHLDVHGALMSYKQLEQGVEADRYAFQRRYGREDLDPYEGYKAFLFLEGSPEQPYDPVEAGELASLLMTHQVPVVMLSACQPGSPEGMLETGLAAWLMLAGVQAVVGMNYSMTVDAARRLMVTLYRALFDGQELAEALRQGRVELHNQKGRKVYFGQSIDLEDWLLPVVYQNRPVQVQVRTFTLEEQQAYEPQQSQAFPFPELAYGFFGRDLDILEIEKRLLRDDGQPHNMLLVKGIGGSGKTTLLRHLGAWWQATRFVQEVFYFAYDGKAHTAHQIVHAIVRRLLGEATYHDQFQSMDPAAEQEMVVQRLQAERHLLVLDNLESITGSHLAAGDTLPEAEQGRLKGFLAQLAGGKTVVLLGSRGEEAWLAQGGPGELRALQEADCYELRGLDPEAASGLAESILRRHGAARHLKSRNLDRLLKLLDGYPLALEVTLASLKRKTPRQVLEALGQGLAGSDAGGGAGKAGPTKTESIVQSVEYSHSNLSPEVQGLLACLAPFTGGLNPRWLPQYSARLRAQPALAGMPFERWDEVLAEARRGGLLSEDPDMPGYLIVEPALPYFLRICLGQPEQAGRKAAVETAFREYYEIVGGTLDKLWQSREPSEKLAGLALSRAEYANLRAALALAFRQRISFINIYGALSEYLEHARDNENMLELAETMLREKQRYPAKALAGRLGVEFILSLDWAALCYLGLERYDRAESAYLQELKLIEGHAGMDVMQADSLRAETCYQLGRVSQEQQQWQQAEGYYRRALEIYVDYNDRYGQARACYNLGRVTQDQRQWQQAEDYYRQALEIFIQFNYWSEQARTCWQLGRVTQEQWQWEQAEGYYRRALEIYVKCNDRYGKAQTYHNLGSVAQEQRQWEQAKGYFMEALQIGVELQDEYGTSVTLNCLGRLSRSSGDDSLPEAVAGVLGTTIEAVQTLWKRAADAAE